MTSAEHARLTERVELLRHVSAAKLETAAAKRETVAQMGASFRRGIVIGAFGMLGACILALVLIGALT